MKRFLNWQGETIDELSRSDFVSNRDFTREMNRLRAEYAMVGMFGTWSQRACANWKG